MLRDGAASRGSGARELDPGSRLVEPVYLEEGVVIGRGCSVGPEVYLEAGCTVADGAQIRSSIVLRRGRVGAGEVVEHRVVT